jgi:cysteine desulfurase
MRRVYLDNNATTPLAPKVFEAMSPYWVEDFGNASSTHWYGQRARAAVEEAREQVARLINARADEIVFTSGGTEGDNAALFGVAEAAPGRERDATHGKHIVTSSIEHHAVLNAAKVLEQRGVTVTFVPVGATGVVDPTDVEYAIRPGTVLISIMHANNELGTLQPVEEIGRIARAHGVVFHTDAVQSAGKIRVDVGELRADLLTLSAHKLHGPKGVGALYVRKGTRFRPLVYGGHHERDRRAGTENVPGLVGFGKAAELAREHLDENASRLGRLRDRLEAAILNEVPSVKINGDPARRLPGTTNLRFEFVDGEAFVIAMDLRQIACSTGAACSSGSLEPSHVLAAIGLSRDQARASIRFSLGAFNTDEDIDQALEALPDVVERLRSLSPRYDKQAAGSRL